MRTVPDHRAEAVRRPEQAEPEVTGVERHLRQHDLRDVHEGDRQHRQVPREEHGQERPGAQDEPEPLSDVVPVSAAFGLAPLEQCPRDPEQEQPGDAEADGIDDVGRIRAGGCNDDSADQRPERDRQLLGEPQQPVRLREIDRRDQVRQPGVGGRPREAGCDPGQQRQRDDLTGGHGEREQDEHHHPHDVRTDEAACGTAGRRAARAGARSRPPAGSRRSAAR
jgi:hypothetical protein